MARQLEADQLRGDTVERLTALTGMDFGDDLGEWRHWWDNRSDPLGKDRLVAYLASQTTLNKELGNLFEADARGRSRRLYLEVAFFWALWCILVVGVFAVRVRTSSTSLCRQSLCPALKGLVVGSLFGIVALAPWVALGYGASAFLTWRGPGFMSCSGPYLWHGGVHYGATIGYRTFVEVLGTPALWLLRKVPWPGETSLVMPLGITTVLMLALAGFVIGLALGLITAPSGAYHRTSPTYPT